MIVSGNNGTYAHPSHKRPQSPPPPEREPVYEPPLPQRYAPTPARSTMQHQPDDPPPKRHHVQTESPLSTGHMLFVMLALSGLIFLVMQIHNLRT